MLLDLFPIPPCSCWILLKNVHPYRYMYGPTLWWSVWVFFCFLLKNAQWLKFQSFSLPFLNDATRNANLKGIWNKFLTSAISRKIIFTIPASLFCLFNYYAQIVTMAQSQLLMALPNCKQLLNRNMLQDQFLFLQGYTFQQRNGKNMVLLDSVLCLCCRGKSAASLCWQIRISAFSGCWK